MGESWFGYISVVSTKMWENFGEFVKKTLIYNDSIAKYCLHRCKLHKKPNKFTK